MKRTGQTSFRARWHAGVFDASLLVLLALAACSSSGDTEDAISAAPGTSTTMPGPEGQSPAEITPLTSEEWGAGVVAAWDTHLAARSDLAGIYIEGVLAGDSEVVLAATLFEEESQVLAILLETLPGPPPDDVAAGIYERFISAIENDQQAVSDWSETLHTDVDVIQADFDRLQGESIYVRIREDRSDSENTLTLMCFEVQTAIADSGGEVLDCVDSDESDASTSGADSVTIDPTEEATGFVSMPEIDPGTYTFAVFRRPVTLTFEQPVVIGTTTDAIEISLGEDDIFFVATESVADPANLAPDCCVAGIPLPADLGSWIDELPVKIVDDGSWLVGGVESAWVDIEFDFEAEYEGDPVIGLVSFSDGFGLTLFPEMTMRLSRVEHPDGPLLIGVYAVDQPMATLSTTAEAIVSSVSFTG